MTSQFSGTYTYLPPEVFTPNPAKISSRVDVWAVGVIFFEMLTGKKPFPVSPHSVAPLFDSLEFPAKPPVSPEAKDFIRLCLSRKESRPDVLELYAVFMNHER